MPRRTDYLPSLRELLMIERYQDEEMAAQIIYQKIFGRKPICPKCGVGELRSSNSSGQLYCNKTTSCGCKVNMRDGTIFYNSSTPLLTWFKALDVVYKTKGMLSGPRIAKVIGVSPETAKLMRFKLLRELGIPDPLIQGRARTIRTNGELQAKS